MSLLDQLQFHLKMEEDNATREDAHTGNIDFTQSGAIGRATGKVGSFGADFERDDNRYLSHADDAATSLGDIDLTIAFWVKWETTPGVGGADVLAFKGDFSGDYSFSIAYSNADGLYCFASSDGGIGGGLTLFIPSPNVTFSAGDWHLIVWEHDATANTLKFYVDNVATNTGSHSGGVFAGGQPWIIGAQNAGGVTAAHLDGVMDSFSFWNRKLTPTELAYLWNSGNGRDYEAFAASGGGGKLLLHQHHNHPL